MNSMHSEILMHVVCLRYHVLVYASQISSMDRLNSLKT